MWQPELARRGGTGHTTGRVLAVQVRRPGVRRLRLLPRGAVRDEPMTARELPGVEIDEHAPIQRCKACPAQIWFGRTAAGKPCPFDVVDGVKTAITHFSTCPGVRQFERKRGRT